MRNSPQTVLYAAAAAALVLVVVCIVQGIRRRRARREHEERYRTDSFSPADTFSGTLRHLGGLPVPAGTSLGVAANHAFGMVFAKGRFRYAVEKKDVAFVELVADAKDLTLPPHRRNLDDFLPCRYVRIGVRRRGELETLLFSHRLFSSFPRRLQAAMTPCLPEELSQDT